MKGQKLQLKSFEINYFRSIKSAKLTNLDGLTVLVGKNNEGKSNILKALGLAVNVFRQRSRSRGRSYRSYDRELSDYKYERDFPSHLQGKRHKDVQSRFMLTFSLNEADQSEFEKQFKLKPPNNLSCQMSFDEGNKYAAFARDGKHTKSLFGKFLDVHEFILSRISFTYIPAVRTEKLVNDIIRQMISNSLSKLNSNKEYAAAMQVIEDLHQPIFAELASKLKLPLREYMPEIEDVSIDLSRGRYIEEKRYISSNDITLNINDGTKTSITQKGDGIKSLAALALLKENRAGTNPIVAIEEPESHLHPGAIHTLVKVISELAVDQQVLISTHNPLFVDRLKISNNIIVDEGKATPATSTRQIREALGTKISDNLYSSKYALVVEGECDKRILEAILMAKYADIHQAFKSAFITTEVLGGASHLVSRLRALHNDIFEPIVFLDNDKPGKDAFGKASDASLLTIKSAFLSKCNGMTQSELEDCIDPMLYVSDISERFGVELKGKAFRSNRKWSERVKSCFDSQGKPWNDDLLKEIKVLVARCVEENPLNALSKNKATSIHALAKHISLRLEHG